MEKMIMKLACSFNRWLYKKHGVVSATKDYFGKHVHLTSEAFFEMFKSYDRIGTYTVDFDKVFVREDGVTYFALVEREDDF